MRAPEADRAPADPRSRRSAIRDAALPRWLSTHPATAAGLLLAAFVTIYLWPVLVEGRILSPLTNVYGFSPWKHYVPGDAHGYFNPVLFDVPMANYPLRWLVRSLLHAGVFPAWNPHTYAGAPLYANPQTGLFSLFSLPLWVLPLNYGIGLGAALKLWASGFGTYLLVRELRLSFLPAVLAGVCFGFSALNIVWLTHETLPAVAAMLPWMAWLVERIFRGGRWGSMAGLAAVTAIGLGGGHPGMQAHLLVAVGLYVLVRAALQGRAPWRDRARVVGLAFGALALGTLLMAFMVLPEVLSSRGTIGTAARGHGGVLPGSEMPFEAIRTVVFPDWWGRPSAVEIMPPSGTLPNFNERTFYAGVVGLMLAAMALLSRGAWRLKAPLVVLAVIGLATPLHAPGLYWLATHLPLLATVQSQRMHFMFEFAVAVLAAFGLDDALRRPRAARRRALVVLGAFALAWFSFTRSGAQPGDVDRVVRHFLTGVDFATPGVLALTSVAWLGLLALAVGLAVAAVWRWPRHRHAIAALVVVLAMVDAYHFAHGYQPMTPARAVPPATPAVRYLQRHEHEGRVVGLGGTLMPEWALTNGLDDIRGYDPPQPTERYQRLWSYAQPDQDVWRPFQIEGLDARSLRVVSVLGSRFVVTSSEAVPPEVKGLRVEGRSLRPLPRVFAGPDAVVFRNPNAAPRAMLPDVVRLASGEQETLEAMAAPRFDPRRAVVLEREQPGVSGLGGARGEVAISRDRNATVTMRASLERSGLVVLNDNWSAGWSVRVDGRPATALRVNDVMRGVAVGRGRHEITWSYAVPGLRLGVALSLLALGLLCAALVLHARGERRRRAGVVPLRAAAVE